MHRTILSLLFAVSAAILAQAAEAVRHEPADYPADAASYRRLAREVERHWRDDMLAHWFPRAVDREHGGFLSELGEDWTPGKSNDKTIVYQARMTWVAAQVAIRHPELREEFLGYTRHGVDCLARVLWDKDHGGFFWGLDESGRITDRYGDEKHIYGISFGIYALAAAHEATKDERALDLAKRAFAWLERHAHDAEAGGYREALTRDGTPILTPAPGRRATDAIGVMYGYKSMNSHIHLLEAMTELYGVWPDPLVRTRLEELLTIVRDKVAVAPGCLNLFFTRDWRAVPDHDSFGHDVETTYLLLEAAEALHAEDEHTVAVARSLLDHALAWGWDETNGGFYDKGAAWSTAWGREKIWWTQAEGLNTLLLMHERFGDDDPRYYRAFLKQWDFCLNHQADRVHGGWHNTVSAEGHAEPGQSKATIWKAAYHDGRALMNVADRLRRMAK